MQMRRWIEIVQGPEAVRRSVSTTQALVTVSRGVALLFSLPWNEPPGQVTAIQVH